MARRKDWPIGKNIEHVADEPGLEGLAEETRDFIAAAVDDLPPEYRMIIEMRLWQQLPFRKIARNLGYKSHASIVSKYNEALEMVRRDISEDYQPDE